MSFLMKVKQTPVYGTILNLLSLKLGIQGVKKEGIKKADISVYHDVLLDEVEKHGLDAQWSLVASALIDLL